jgi:hypothetical protein
MLPARLRLLAGVSPDRAVTVLEALIALAADLNNWMTPEHPPCVLRDQYLNWTEAVEQQLVTLTLDQDALHILYTDRYWHIRAMTDPRPVPLVRAERDEQVTALKAWATELGERQGRLSATSGQTVIVDTNIFLEFLPPEQIPWAEVLKVPSVRLVIPLRVVEELDMKKYARSSSLSARARQILPSLRELLEVRASPVSYGLVRPWKSWLNPLRASGLRMPTRKS